MPAEVLGAHRLHRQVFRFGRSFAVAMDSQDEFSWRRNVVFIRSLYPINALPSKQQHAAQLQHKINLALYAQGWIIFFIIFKNTTWSYTHSLAGRRKMGLSLVWIPKSEV